MSLEEEVKNARHEIVTDGYDMSIGELMSLYREQELTINPIFQRYFVWAESQKTRFIESVILGIPVPPIFVYKTIGVSGNLWTGCSGFQRSLSSPAN